MNHNKKRFLLIIGLLLVAALALTACGEAETVEVEVTRMVETEVTREVEVPGPEVEVEVTRIVEVMLESETAVDIIPFEEMWASSPHNNVEGEAFNNWNEDDPKEIPVRCAKCHSTPGHLDFLGVDGTEAGVVNNPSPLGTTIQCVACHNEVTVDKTSVVFPSGIEITGLGDEARCMECHQGRQSTVSVNASIETAAVGDDEVSADLGFLNIHYYAAAATLYGTAAKGGYEYADKAYDAKFAHVEGYETCISCHDPHTLEVQFDECTACHTGLNSAEDLVNVRMAGSLVDYDGDGDMEEGIAGEISGLQEALFTAITAYAAEVAGAPITYDSASHPYFKSEDGSGAYTSWTPRLLRAAYNYQVSKKDPGNYAHGGKYAIQLLYDSIENLNEALATPIDMSAMRRIDHGHFAGSEQAFRNWDEDGEVPGRCSKCHTDAGLPQFAKEGVNTAQHPSSGLSCATCHNDLQAYTLYEFAAVTFPNGASLTLEEPGSNSCLNCHQGRAAGVTVERAIAGQDADAPNEALRFINIHYFAAGATLFGSEANGLYEFADQSYVGRNEHVGQYDTCIECHNAHALEVEVVACADCHDNVTSKADLAGIREDEVDYDGDGDVTEGLAGEISTMADALFVALEGYTETTVGAKVVYNPARHPYYFNEAGESYNQFTPRSLRAAYNYQYVKKDPGAYAHNGKYVIQVLYDNLVDMGVDVSGMTRP